ncbi:MAG TPA: hypothetical protein VGG86_03745 [Roseiarcus sp.]|jgi:hypothetical protein
MTGQASPVSLVRGKHVMARALDRHRWEQIDDGAVLQRDGFIVAAGGAFYDGHYDFGRRRLLPPELEDIGAHAPIRRDTTIVGV